MLIDAQEESNVRKEVEEEKDVKNEVEEGEDVVEGGTMCRGKRKKRRACGWNWERRACGERETRVCKGEGRE